MRKLYACKVCCPGKGTKQPECFELYPSGVRRSTCKRCIVKQAAVKRRRQADFDMNGWMQKWGRV